MSAAEACAPETLIPNGRLQCDSATIAAVIDAENKLCEAPPCRTSDTNVGSRQTQKVKNLNDSGMMVPVGSHTLPGYPMDGACRPDYCVGEYVDISAQILDAVDLSMYPKAQ